MVEFSPSSARRISKAVQFVERHGVFAPDSGQRGRWTQWPSRWECGILDGPLAAGGSATVSIWDWNGAAFVDSGINITAHDWAMTPGSSLPAQTYVIVLKHHRDLWVVIPVGAGVGLVELCLAENHPGRGLPFDAYLGVWDDVTNGWRYETGTGSVCEGDGIVKAIDWRHGVPYPEAGAKGLFTPRDSYEFGTIYECVSLDCTSPGACCTYETGP